MICLDSSFLIDLLRNKKEAIKKLETFRSDTVGTTRINLFEVLFGVFIKKGITSQQIPKRVKSLIDKIEVMELDEHSCIQAANIKSELILKGKEIESADCLIAGIMLANACNIIATKNKDHFDRIKGLEVEGY